MIYYSLNPLIIKRIIQLLTIKRLLIIINRSLKTYLIILYGHQSKKPNNQTDNKLHIKAV